MTKRNKDGLEALNNQMCFTTADKYIVDGKEVPIDGSEVPISVLKKLEASPMTQLDALYIRKRIHLLAEKMDEFGQSVAKHFIHIDERVDETEKRVENFTKHEILCQAERVPEIAENIVHKVVNGKFEKISKTLESISTQQNNTKNELVKYKEHQQEQYDTLISKIDYTAEKTIFGWIKKQYEKRPIRTLLVGFVLAILLFMYVSKTLGFNSFSEIYEYIKEWFV